MKWFLKPQADRAVTALGIGNGAAAVRLEPAGPSGLPRVTFVGRGANVRDSLKAWQKSGVFRRSRLVLVLPTALRSVHTLARPDVPDAELTEAVRWQLANALDYPPEEALLDVLPLAALAANQPAQVMAVCARVSVVQAHIAPLLAAGLKPDVIDVNDMAQRNLSLLASRQAPASACIGYDGGEGLLTVTAEGELCMSRSILLGDVAGDGHAPPDRNLVAERLALQLQRTLDTFERQATNFAVRRLHVLPHMPNDDFATLLASHVAQAVEAVSIEAHFDLTAVQADWYTGPIAGYIHLLGSAWGRLAEAPEAVAQATEKRAHKASAEAVAA